MKIPIPTRIEPEFADKLKDYADRNHWTISQAVREIIAQFFNYELSANDG